MPKFKELEMKAAVKQVIEDGLSVNRVAKENGLCKKTLKSYLEKFRNSEEMLEEMSFKPSYEINQVFTNSLEKVFEDHLLSLFTIGQNVTRDVIRCAAFDFATNCNVHVPKTWNVRKQAGLDWMYGFLNRHPNIKNILARGRHFTSDDENKKSTPKRRKIKRSKPKKIKQDEEQEYEILGIEDIHIDDDSNVDLSETDEFNQIMDIDEAFVNYPGDINTHIERKHSGFTISLDNDFLSGIGKTPLDEFQENLVSAYSCIAHQDSIVPSKRVFNLGEILLVTRDNGLSATACCIVNAAGESLPPFFVLPHQKLKMSWLLAFPEGIGGTARPGGCMDDDAFILVLKHFQDIVKSDDCENKVVLIMDDEVHHITVNSLEFCEQHGIELVTVPPHFCSNLMPIGRYVFPTLKEYFHLFVDKFQGEISIFHIISIFYKIYDFVFSGVNISNGFFDTGIYPLDDQVLLNEAMQAGKGPPKYTVPVLEDEISLDFLDSPPMNGDEDDDNSRVVEKNTVKAFPSIQVEQEVITIKADETEEEQANDVRQEELVETRSESAMIEFVSNFKNAIREIEHTADIQQNKIYSLEIFPIMIRSKKSYLKRTPHMSVCLFSNAAGENLPAFIVFPDNCFHTKFLEHLPESMSGSISPRGGIDSEIFEKILKYFHQHVKPSPDRKVLLLTHIKDKYLSLSIMDFLNENGILMVGIPEIATEPFLPLERSVFKNMAVEFYKKYSKFLKQKGEGPTTMINITSLLADTLKELLKPDEVAAAFLLSGLWPLDTNLFSDIPGISNITNFDDLSKAGPKYERAMTVKPFREVIEDKDIEYEDEEFELDTVLEVPVSDDEDYEDVMLFYNNIEEFIDSLKKKMIGIVKEDEEVLTEKCIYVLGKTKFNFNATCHITLFLVSNSVGSLLPPFIVYPPEMNESAFPENSLNMTGVSAVDGIIDDKVFISVLNHFCLYAVTSVKNHLLLLMESKANYVTDAVISFLDEHEITLKTLPGNDPKKYNPLQKPLIQPLEQRFEQINKRKRRLLPVSLQFVVKFLEDKLVELIDAQKLVASFTKLGFGTIITRQKISEDETKADIKEKKLMEEIKTEEPKQGIKGDLEHFIIEEEIEEPFESDDLTTFTVVESCLPARISCLTCGMKFKTAEFTRKHEDTFRCRYCDMICCDAVKRSKHEDIHVKDGKHYCAFCSKICASKAAIIQHRKKHFFKQWNSV